MGATIIVMGKSNRPDFICIGPEKTGTTWLFSILEEHPQVWLPPYKELQFLTEGNFVPEYSLKNLFFNSHWHYLELRRLFVRNTAKMFLLRKTSMHGPFSTYLWLLKYLFGAHDFAWYSSLFDPDEGQICGDITPNYYYIPEARIIELKRHCPDLKVLLIVRDPIERAWSAAVMIHCAHRKIPFEEVSHADFLQTLDNLYHNWRPYRDVIEMWKRHFSNVHIAFFDDLKADPERFANEVCTFLGVDKLLDQASIRKVVGKGVGGEIPAEIYAHLLSQYQDESPVSRTLDQRTTREQSSC